MNRDSGKESHWLRSGEHYPEYFFNMKTLITLCLLINRRPNKKSIYWSGGFTRSFPQLSIPTILSQNKKFLYGILREEKKNDVIKCLFLLTKIDEITGSIFFSFFVQQTSANFFIPGK